MAPDAGALPQPPAAQPATVTAEGGAGAGTGGGDENASAKEEAPPESLNISQEQYERLAARCKAATCARRLAFLRRRTAARERAAAAAAAQPSDAAEPPLAEAALVARAPRGEPEPQPDAGAGADAQRAERELGDLALLASSFARYLGNMLAPL